MPLIESPPYLKLSCVAADVEEDGFELSVCGRCTKNYRRSARSRRLSLIGGVVDEVVVLVDDVVGQKER